MNCSPRTAKRYWHRSLVHRVAPGLIAGWLGVIAAEAVDIPVNGHLSGRLTTPSQALAQALAEARHLPTDTPRRLVIHAGTYENVRLVLGPQDSGLEIVAAPGSEPRFLGGQILKGWTRDGDKFFSAPLPPFPDFPEDESLPTDLSRWEIRALVVNGELAPRARYPRTGRLNHETSFDVPWMSTTGGGWQRRPTDTELTTLRYQPGDLGPWLNVTNTEITVYHMWDDSCVGLAAHDLATRTLRLTPKTGHPPGAFGVKQYVLWNLREGMTAPGQWYHDRVRQRVVYWPRQEEDIHQLEIVVPTSSTLLHLRGENGRPVRDVRISGLHFACTTVPLRAGGFAANAYPGAIVLENAADCRLDNLTVRGVAGHAIKTGRNITAIKVFGCEITQCGAGGVYVGGTGSVIEDNHIHGIGRQYPSAIGIYRGGRDCVVRHNEVHDCSYSAINYGGTRNLVENNLIYDCMKVLHDGAAIYMFAADNCVLRGNFARDIIDTGGYGASAYYLDERSTGCVVENNVSLRVARPSHNHMATNNVIRNNLFFVEGDARLTFPRSTRFTLERNLIVATGKIRFENSGAIERWNRNLLFSGANRIERVTLDRYSTREVLEGAPPGSSTEDPLLGNWREGDFAWPTDSPANRLGIQPVDVSRAGPRPPQGRN